MSRMKFRLRDGRRGFHGGNAGGGSGAGDFLKTMATPGFATGFPRWQFRRGDRQGGFPGFDPGAAGEIKHVRVPGSDAGTASDRLSRFTFLVSGDDLIAPFEKESDDLTSASSSSSPTSPIGNPG